MSDGGRVLIELNLAAFSRQVARVDPVAEKRREDIETGRRAAQEFAYEALHGMVHLMRTSQDEGIKFKAQQEIMNRAWGKTKPLTEEEKQGADAATILDILGEMSRNMTAIENEAARPKLIESTKEETDYYDADAILIEAEKEKDNG
jgi:hypothetical protein